MLIVFIVISLALYLTLMLLGKGELVFIRQDKTQDRMQDKTQDRMQDKTIYKEANSYNDNLGDNLRIALHITGDSRRTSYINSMIIAPLRSEGIVVDVFMYCDQSDNEIFTQPVVSLSHDYIRLPEELTKHNSRIMFFRMKMLQEAYDAYCIENKVTYDYIIRIRPDIILERHLRREDFIEDSLVVFPRVALPLSPKPSVMTDIIIIGPEKLMRRVNYIYDFYKKTSCINPEVFLYNFIRFKELPYTFNTTLNPSCRSIGTFSINIMKGIKIIETISSSMDCNVTELE